MRIPQAIANSLDDEELAAVLGHELGHVREHLSTLWLSQVLSRLCLTGPGYLGLLLDSGRIELDADRYAVAGVGLSPAALERALNKLAVAGTLAQVISGPAGAMERRHQRVWRKLGQWIERQEVLRAIRDAYDVYFGAALWGYSYPPLEERIQKLRAAKA